jgi:Protein of unknown function (DUF4199)
MKKILLTYGLISGAIAAALMLCTATYFHSTGDTRFGEYFGYTGILLSMIFVFLGVRAYREQVQAGSITFGKAFQVGILITVISCLCYVIAWLFVYHFIMPDFLDKYIAHALEQLQQSGASAEKISKQVAEMESYRKMYENPFLRFIMTFLEPFPVGLLVTLLTAVVLRRKAG